jgi:proteasome lid subunit RPN8/RPN11
VVADLTLPRPIAEALMAHARAQEPNEACGLLAGSVFTGGATAYHPARNAEASPLRYTVHPDDLLRITLAIDDAGEDLLAIFHSHTRSPAVPSATDLREARYREPFYLIASLSGPAVSAERSLRAWRIVDGAATEVSLRLE